MEIKHAIVINWDAETQTPSFQIDPAQVKNLEFAMTILEMVKDSMKFNSNLMRMSQVQQQQMQAARDREIQRKIMGG